MTAYLSLIKIRFLVELQYRAAAAAGFFTQFFFGFVRAMVFIAFYSSTTQVQPMSLDQAVTYSWLVQVTFRMIPWYGDTEMINMIRSGGVAYELCRPLNLYAAWYSRLLAQRVVPVLLGGIPTLVLALLLPGHYGMALPVSPSAGLAFFVSLVGALFLGCAVTNIISISTLWTVAGEGMQRIVPTAVMFLSGLTIPLAFFPDWSQPVLGLLPFSSLADVPYRFYIGAIPSVRLFQHLALQAAWTFLFIVFGLWLLRVGTNRAVIQGG